LNLRLRLLRGSLPAKYNWPQYGLGHSRLDIVKLYLGSLGYEDLARVHQGASPVDNLGVRVGRKG